MKFVGHEATLRALPDPLPHALLLTGPEGVGKRWLAWILARSKSGAQGLDIQTINAPFSMDKARRLIGFHEQRPIESDHRVSVIDLTGASGASLHAILKILEEPPEYSRFILHTDREPLLTIRSRCHTLRFGLLTPEQVQEVLESKGIGNAYDAAQASGGRVSVALTYVYGSEARGRVEVVVRALEARNAKRLESALYSALQTAEVENPEAVRAMVATLLQKQIMESITNEAHALAFVPVEARRDAVRTLMTPARPALKVRGAVWTMAAAC